MVAIETPPATGQTRYGKPCRHALSYGNLELRIFRLCWSVTCASRPSRLVRPRTYNATRCWRRALTAGTCLRITPPAPGMIGRGLIKALGFVRPGDVLVVWKLDWLGLWSV